MGFYAGTKCKELNNTIYNTLNTRMKHNDKTPAILLLGGDRSQTIGSMSGAFRAYQDLCCIYFDAQFNFRDPHMNGVYGITHGSPHFLLFQKNLRDAIKRWEESDESYRQAPEQQGKREAKVSDLHSTPSSLRCCVWTTSCSLATPSAISEFPRPSSASSKASATPSPRNTSTRKIRNAVANGSHRSW